MGKRGQTRKSKGDGETGRKTVVRNRRARHQYRVLDTFEAGIELKGAEVKSLRAGSASLEGSFAQGWGGEIFLVDAQINPYSHDAVGRLEPRRRRKLLLHRREIRRLIDKSNQRGFTMVPLSIYFARGKAKVELALCAGKTHGDKRQAMKEADVKRQIDRARAGLRRGR